MEFFNLHTHQFTADDTVLELVNQYPWDFREGIPYYSIGIHPWYIDTGRLETDFRILEEKLNDKNCLALGECGLDKRIEIPLALQLEVFERQALLAQVYGKPLVLHLVGAFQELTELTKRLKITVPVVLHGFSKNTQLAAQMLDQGFYLSFGKYLWQRPELKEVFHSVPNERFFLETDTMEVPLPQIYELAAGYKNIPVSELQSIIHNNFNRFFGPVGN